MRNTKTEKQRHRDGVEIGRADADLSAGDGFGDQWKDRAEKDRKQRRHQDDVIEQESRLAADHGVELGLFFQ